MRLHDGVYPEVEGGPRVKGAISTWEVPDDGSPIILRARTRNQIQYTWGAIAAELFGKGAFSHRINAMYIEFENTGSAVSIPTFGRDEGLEYYENLQFVASRDFLRISLPQEPTVGIEPGFEDYFTAGTNGNLLTFGAQTAGTEGIHGTAFSNGASSTIFGAALVATPVFADRTQDVIFSRGYLDVADQIIKPVSAQIRIGWGLSFE